MASRQAFEAPNPRRTHALDALRRPRPDLLWTGTATVPRSALTDVRAGTARRTPYSLEGSVSRRDPVLLIDTIAKATGNPAPPRSDGPVAVRVLRVLRRLKPATSVNMDVFAPGPGRSSPSQAHAHWRSLESHGASALHHHNLLEDPRGRLTPDPQPQEHEASGTWSGRRAAGVLLALPRSSRPHRQNAGQRRSRCERYRYDRRNDAAAGDPRRQVASLRRLIWIAARAGSRRRSSRVRVARSSDARSASPAAVLAACP